MERCQLSILKSIHGLPSPGNPSPARHTSDVIICVQGSSPVLRRLILLPVDATDKAILLLYRLIHSQSLITRCSVLLRYLSLPDIPFLISHTPSKQGLKRCVSLAAYSLIENALDASVSSSPSLYDIYLAQHSFGAGRPFQLLSITTGDMTITHLVSYRICLQLHCSNLATDTGMFRPVLNRHCRSTSCPLCNKMHSISSSAVRLLEVNGVGV